MPHPCAGSLRSELEHHVLRPAAAEVVEPRIFCRYRSVCGEAGETAIKRTEAALTADVSKVTLQGTRTDRVAFEDAARLTPFADERKWLELREHFQFLGLVVTHFLPCSVRQHFAHEQIYDEKEASVKNNIHRRPYGP